MTTTVYSAVSFTTSGTGGAGFYELINQASAPSTPASSVLRLYSGGGNLAWKASDGFVRSIVSSISADRTYTFPDVSGTMLSTNSTATLTNKTIQGSTNVVDADNLKTTTTSVNVSASAAPGGSGYTLLTTSSTTATWQVAVTASSSTTFTNKTIQGSTNVVDADNLKTTTTSVNCAAAAAPPGSGYALVTTSATTATWQSVITSTPTIYTWVVSETVSTGVQGSTSPPATATWLQRNLNTVATNYGSSVLTLSSNTITFTLSGTYYIEASVPAYNVSQFMARFYNSSAASALLYSPQETASGSNQNRAIVRGNFTVSGSTNYQLQQYLTSSNDNAFGIAIGISGISEQYSVLTIIKLS